MDTEGSTEKFVRICCECGVAPTARHNIPRCRPCAREESIRRNRPKYLERLGTLVEPPVRFIALSEDNEWVTYGCPHGEHRIRRANALRSLRGCRSCEGERRIAAAEERVLAKLSRAFPGRGFDLSRVRYRGAEEKIAIVCRDHGEFSVYPANYYRELSDCPGCREGRPSRAELAWFGELRKGLEVRGFGELASQGLSQVPVGNFVVDMTFGPVALEYDGAYWHSLPGMAQRDGLKNRVLREHGYAVLRLRVRDGKNKLPPLAGSRNIEVPPLPGDDPERFEAVFVELLKLSDALRDKEFPRNLADRS